MSDRLYTETHEWLTVDGDVATVGITDFAQAQLGDVVFMELPPVGRRLTAGSTLGSIESVKAASDLYSPVDGEVIEVNQELSAAPQRVNEDPYGEGWMLKIKLDGPLPAGLLDQAAYDRLTASGH